MNQLFIVDTQRAAESLGKHLPDWDVRSITSGPMVGKGYSKIIVDVHPTDDFEKYDEALAYIRHRLLPGGEWIRL